MAGNVLILAVVDLCVNTIPYCSQWISAHGFFTRLFSQPFQAAASFVCLANPRVPGDKAKLVTNLKTTSERGSIFFLALTFLLMTLMSVERWLHMSTRRSFFTSCRGYSVMIVLLFIPISTDVFRVLENESRKYKHYRRFTISVPSFTCYQTTSFAYFNVYRIIRCHQWRAQGISHN